MTRGAGCVAGTIGRVVAGTAVVMAAVAVPGGGTALAQCDIDAGRETFDLRSSTATDPIVLRTDDTIRVERPADGVLGVVVWFGPAPIPLPSIGDGGREVEVALGDVSWLGVGLYRVDVFGPGAGECSGTFWVRVEGRSPLTTVAGLGSIVVLVAGLVFLTSAVRRGRRQRCSIVRGTVGGLLSGVGVGALGQQVLFLPMQLPVIGVALFVPALVGGLLARGACVPPVVKVTLTPVLFAPLVVRRDEDFDVRVGVDVDVPPGRRRRATHETTHDVTAHLVCAGAELAAGQTWRQRLDVRAGAAVAEHVVRMRATRDIGESHLTALYSSGGQTIGAARRPLWVVDAGDALPPPQVARVETAGLQFSVPVEQAPVDLELRATFAGPRALHVLHWTIETPHRNRLAVPDRPLVTDLGSDPQAFAAELLLDVTENEGRAGLDELLLGAGRQLARCFDPAVREVLRGVLELVPRARVLVLSEESSVPWELTTVEPAPPGEPPFLATRAVVGRWFLDPGAVRLPPPVGVPGGSRHVIAADELPAAQVEARRLQAELAFVPAPATVAGVLDSLEQAGTVHLACHGNWRIDQGRFTLELSDGRVVPKHVAGLRLSHRPFVFLNACQIGSGGDVLGTPTGFPAELVFGGASGSVMPLWSVRDDEACEIALAFYGEVLAGRPPAEVIREQRWRAMTDGRPTSTPFAYQYIGHPDLRLAVPPASASRAA